MIASQLFAHCDVISNRLWHHQQNENWVSETQGRCVNIVLFIVIYGFVLSCKKKIMYVLSWRTASALTRVFFWCLFPLLLRNSENKHQINPLLSAETVRHLSTYIILYISIIQAYHIVIDKSFLYSTYNKWMICEWQLWRYFELYFIQWNCFVMKIALNYTNPGYSLSLVDTMLPGRHQAIIWTNAGILLIGLLGTNFSEILIEIHTFSLKKMCLKTSSGKWHPLCLSINVLTKIHTTI